MRHCIFCNNELPNHAQFCGFCGHFTSAAGERTPSVSGRSVQDGSTFISNPSIKEQKGVGAADTYITPYTNNSNNNNNNAIWSPLVPQRVQEEEEQDRCRRALVWGVPLTGAGIEGPNGAPAIQGTPQMNGAPTVQGTPRAQASEGQFLGHHPAPQNMVPPRAQYPYAVAPQVTRSRTQKQTRTHKKRASEGARTAQGAVTKWLIVVVTAALVLATAGVTATFALSPTLSGSGLSGNSVVVQGQHLNLQGKGFLPGGHITLKRDTNQAVQLVAQNGQGTREEALVANHSAAFSVSPLVVPTNSAIIVNSGGTFDAVLLVGMDWLQGKHTILATEDVLGRSATMIVNVGDAAPMLAVVPGSLDFGLVQTGTKTSVTLAIGNTGGQPLAWTATADGEQWLSLQAMSGDILPHGMPQSVTVTCDATSLAVGTYTATIHMHSNGGNATVKVTVKVISQPQAKLSVAPPLLDFQTMSAGQQAAQTIVISNTGTIMLDWQAVSDQDWVTLDKTNNSLLPGAVAQRLSVQVDTSGMRAGSYSALVTITSNGGNAQIPVTVVVPASITPTPVPPTATPTVLVPTPTIVPTRVPQGSICKLPSSLDFGTVVQGQRATRTLTLGNCGNASFTWRPLPDSQWITSDSNGGTLSANTTATIIVTIDTTSLKASTNQGKVTFYTSVGNQAVNITVTVQQPTPVPTPTPTVVLIG